MIQESSAKKGFVYILINPAFTGFVKIGKTIKEPEIRARELSSGSGVPAPYAVAWDALVTDCDQVEKLIHQQLAHARSRNDREFFAIPLKNAISIASSIIAPFSCERDDPLASASLTPHKILNAKPKMTTPRRSPPRVQQKEMIEVAEDYDEKHAQGVPESSGYKDKIYGSPLKDVLDAIIKQAIVDTSTQQMSPELGENLKEYLLGKEASGGHRFLSQLEKRLNHWRSLTSSKDKEKYIRGKLIYRIDNHLSRIFAELLETDR
jgi:hypothetical protein